MNRLILLTPLLVASCIQNTTSNINTVPSDSVESSKMIVTTPIQEANVVPPKIMEKKSETTTNDSMLKISTGDTETMPTTQVTSEATGYLPYDETQVAIALADGKEVALFFHATWCPSCRALDTTLKSSIIPGDKVIFKVDFDTSDVLKKQYRVVGQHTTVRINADKSEKSKKLGAKNVVQIFE